jgi:hypothetical protein
MHFPPQIIESKKLMLPSESTPQKLSNEWSSFENLNFLGKFCDPPFCHHHSLKIPSQLVVIAADESLDG